jgi:hypothetical protein
MFLIDPAGPVTGKFKAQGLRFSESFEWSARCGSDEFVYTPKNLLVL